MSEVLWNIIGVTLIGSLILIVRKTNGDKIHPQILTVYWILFFVASLIPFHMIAKLGAVVGNINYLSDVNNISSGRRDEYLELAAILDSGQNSSLLYKSEVKNFIITFCLIIWIVGFIGCAIIKILKNIRIRNIIKEKYIGIHSCISIGKKNKINVIITENIGPMVYGIRPNIYVPKEFIDSDVLDSILAHEKFHIIRKHYLLLLLIDVTSCIYWFIPYYEKVFMKALREDIEYRCDYEVIKNTSINPKEYTLHYVVVNGYQSGLKVSLNFSKERAMKRISRVLDFNVDMKNSVGMSLILGITIFVCTMWITNAYLKPDINGYTKWEINQAKETVINMINAANNGDEQSVYNYIYKSAPISNVTDFSDMQYDLYYIDYFPSTSNYYEKKYREQYQLQDNKIIHLQGIFKAESSKMIWGYTLIFDDAEGDWKLYDWGQ
jgi:beta-lactamase regulating signal transducer with metallopeptidase domain